MKPTTRIARRGTHGAVAMLAVVALSGLACPHCLSGEGWKALWQGAPAAMPACHAADPHGAPEPHGASEPEPENTAPASFACECTGCGTDGQILPPQVSDGAPALDVATPGLPLQWLRPGTPSARVARHWLPPPEPGVLDHSVVLLI